jgi:hypothetical protein
MTLTERILTVFKGERPDVMPWFADLTYWYNAAAKRGILPERYRGECSPGYQRKSFPLPNMTSIDFYEGEGIVNLYRELGCGCHEHALSRPWATEYEDVIISQSYETDAEGEPVREKTEWRTPVGTLTQIKVYGPMTFSWAYSQYPVASPADLRILCFIYEHMHVRPDYRQQERQLRLWDGVGVLCTTAPKSPPADLIVLWMGVVNFSYALADAPAALHEMLEVTAAATDPIYGIIEQAPGPLVYFADNITGEVVSPQIFDAYYVPHYQRRMMGLHAAGKHGFLHIDGTFQMLLPHIARSGVDCAQSLTAAPVGDVEISEMRALAGPDLILWSGVPGALFSSLYPEQMVRDTVMDCIKYHKEYGRFIIGVCDQVPPDGVIERVKLVTDLVEEYGRL